MQLAVAADIPDSAHPLEEPFDNPLTYLYATCTPLHKGFSEEEHDHINIPHTYKEAIQPPQREQWQAAINDEMESLKKHDVYKLVPISSASKNEKIIGTRFVIKQKADGRFKARLVVPGPRPRRGWKRLRKELRAVCRIGSVRTLLAIACEHG